MIQPQPRLWTCLTREWIPLPGHLASAWWLALCHAKWSLACEWRTGFLALAKRDGWMSAEEVEGFFREVATPQTVFPLLAALMQEGTLLRIDGHRLEEALLRQMSAEGHWRHPKAR